MSGVVTPGYCPEVSGDRDGVRIVKDMRRRVIVHVHASLDPSAGDYTRIRRVRQVLLGLEDATVVEIAVLKLSQLPRMRQWGALYGEAAHRRFFLPLIMPLVEIYSIRMFNHALLVLVGWLFRLILWPDVVVCETLKPWALARALCHTRTLCVWDVHGAAPEEAIIASSGWNRLKWTPERVTRYVRTIEQMERQAVLSADAVISASKALELHLKAKYSVLPEQLWVVYGSSVDTGRFVPSEEWRRETRARLGIDDDCLVFVYSGSLYSWQCIDETIELFSVIIHSGEPTARLLILTSDDHAVIDRSRERTGLDNRTVLVHSVSYRDVPLWLCGADIGIALRHDTVVNRVASPTKVGEYLACGLPMITTPVGNGWCDWSLYHNAVCMVDLSDTGRSKEALSEFIQRYRTKPQQMRQSARDCALDQWSETRATERLHGLLSDLVHAKDLRER